MIVKRPQVERALDAGGAGQRLFLLYGPDEAGSRALAARLGTALGGNAERIDLTGAQLRADPALLADEAGAISLFGGARYIRIEPAGDEIIDAVVALADIPAGGNPVIVIAGALRKDSKLVKYVTGAADMMGVASYAPEGQELDRLAASMASAAGLRTEPDFGMRLAALCGGDRAILAQEIEKLALFVDAAPDRPRELGTDALDAIGAAKDEGDAGKLVDAALDGRLADIDRELAAFSGGVDAIRTVRAFQRRLILLAHLGAEVAAGNSIEAVMAKSGRAIFWKDQKTVSRQLSRWRPVAIARALDRLATTEAALMDAGTPGEVLLDEELFAIGRAAARMR